MREARKVRRGQRSGDGTSGAVQVPSRSWEGSAGEASSVGGTGVPTISGSFRLGCRGWTLVGRGSISCRSRAKDDLGGREEDAHRHTSRMMDLVGRRRDGGGARGRGRRRVKVHVVKPLGIQSAKRTKEASTSIQV